MRELPPVARGAGRPFAQVREAADAEKLSTLDQLLLLSGRDIAWLPGKRP
jgi:hypothetical protein